MEDPYFKPFASRIVCQATGNISLRPKACLAAPSTAFHFNLDIVKGGVETNVVPSEAVFSRRDALGTPEEAKALLHKLWRDSQILIPTLRLVFSQEGRRQPILILAWTGSIS